ncbi:hypothetical protein FKW77_008527 [Venturia effusa]|uniref:Uncharacterized protein n=1 Tax=Venturia effusa TaxID=50376 RepID=A0A517LCR7_9PEZI|nr:hypothetical protein FKW77_008527 [Venturia effusa]
MAPTTTKRARSSSLDEEMSDAPAQHHQQPAHKRLAVDLDDLSSAFESLSAAHVYLTPTKGHRPTAAKKVYNSSASTICTAAPASTSTICAGGEGTGASTICTGTPPAPRKQKATISSPRSSPFRHQKRAIKAPRSLLARLQNKSSLVSAAKAAAKERMMEEDAVDDGVEDMEELEDAMEW